MGLYYKIERRKAATAAGRSFGYLLLASYFKETVLMETSGSSAALAKECARILDRNKLDKIKILNVGDSLQIADYFVLATGSSPRQVKAARDDLLKELRLLGNTSRRLEGYRDTRWVLIDLSDVVIHLFDAESRQFYDLENLWGDCPRLEWAQEPALGRTAGS